MIRHRNADEPRVLSFAQEGLWYLDQLTPNSPVYNVAFFSRLRGSVDPAALEQALNAVVDRHEVLRTVFPVSKGVPTPFPLKKRRVDLEKLDLRLLPESQREAEAQRLIRLQAARPFNLARDLLIRPYLFQLTDHEFIFHHVAPHIVFEGSSVGILYRDLAAFYNPLVSGSAPALPALPFEYSDYALWQREHLQGKRLETLHTYWKDRLTGAATLDVPVDFPRPPVHTQRGARHVFALPADLTRAANALFGSIGTTPYRGLLAAFSIFLSCYTGSDDVCMSSPFAPVRGPRTENLIGYLVNTVVIRMDLSGDPSFTQVIQTADRALWGAMMHSDLPFSKVVEVVQPSRDPSRTPLAQVNFRAPRQRHPSLDLHGAAGTPAEVVDNGTSKFDLALEVESSVGETCHFEYCTDLFREQTIIRMEHEFQELLRALVHQPDTPLSQVNAVRSLARDARPQTSVSGGPGSAGIPNHLD